MFLGSSFPLRLMGIPCGWTGSGKIQDGGLWTLNACLFVPRHLSTKFQRLYWFFRGLAFQWDSRDTMQPYRKWKNPRLQPMNFECMYLRLHTRSKRTSNGYTHSFWVQLSNELGPEPEVKKMAYSELQISICTVLLVYQYFGYHRGIITMKQVKQSRICGTFCAFHFHIGRTSFRQVPVECWTSKT